MVPGVVLALIVVVVLAVLHVLPVLAALLRREFVLFFII